MFENKVLAQKGHKSERPGKCNNSYEVLLPFLISFNILPTWRPVTCKPDSYPQPHYPKKDLKIGWFQVLSIQNKEK